MNDMLADITIPDRPAFKASEVCEIAKVQPYVLRSWESEFPDLGVARTPGGPRVYRRTDVERVLRIRHLVFHDGLTLAGVRRRLDGEAPAAARVTPDPSSLFDDVIGADVKARLAQLKAGLKGLLDLVSRDPVPALASATAARASSATITDFQLEAPSSPASAPAVAHAAAKRAPVRRKTADNA
jgi:DNA-binding transcriptional MerR regulator